MKIRLYIDRLAKKLVCAGLLPIAGLCAPLLASAQTLGLAPMGKLPAAPELNKPEVVQPLAPMPSGNTPAEAVPVALPRSQTVSTPPYSEPDTTPLAAEDLPTVVGAVAKPSALPTLPASVPENYQVSPLPTHPLTIEPVVTAAASTPKPGLMTADVEVPIQESWEVNEGGTLNDLVARWGSRAGWRVVWETNLDYPMQAPFTLYGDFLTAIEQLFDAYKAAPRSFGVKAYPNQVLVVSEKK